VGVLIASGGNLEVLRKNLDALASKTEYRNFEILAIDNSRGGEIERFVRRWRRDGVEARYLDFRGQPFNYSALHNQAAERCQCPLLLFLNDDTEAAEPGWLTAMVELAVRPEVGAVGAKLLYPDGRIQHAGVALGIYGVAGHSFRGLDGRRQHYFDFPDVIRNVSAVTGACLMVRAAVFREVGGFDERRFPVAFNDVDLCLRIGQRGYRVLYTPHALLYHHEAFSKGERDIRPHPAEVAEMQARWGRLLADDPFYSPNLTREGESYLCRRRR
jgi:cellulose synthase/poly-beta-1,6-N-acetylglucosamine synthase-like glycosyltransferase